jgi:DNA mismatch repair protein MutS2
VTRSAEELLEFGRLRELLRRQTTSALGGRAVEALSFGTDGPRLEREFAAIAEAVAWLRQGSEMGFGGLADPAGWFARLDKPGAVLEPIELLEVASLADTAGWLREAFRETEAKFPLLTERARAVGSPATSSLAAAIRRAIEPGGEIRDDASPELRRLRTGIGRTRQNIQSTLEGILRARGEPPGEDYVTQRNDRYVIPVRVSERRGVQGVVHAASATGQTVFLEPLETIELNNRLVQLSEEEAAEIARILEALTGRVTAQRPALTHAAETIAEFDSLFARARFAREYDACMPVFTAETAIALDAARHPVLESGLRRQGRPIVPLTLALGGAETVLVISGPNTGGKTVALKTVGLAVLAAQSGIPVAAQSARLGIFDRLLADIGDEQSIAADLSTFSAHIVNLKAMLGALTEHSLVLVDEMGTGTAPEEGAALAVALLDEFRARRCLVLATTHHDRLKIYASTTPGVLNAAVEFDEERLAPTYRLRVGVPGGSSGIAIARRLGLPETIVERAGALLSPESREAAGLIAYLHRSRDALEQMQRELAEQARSLEAERRALREEWVERQKKRIAELEKRFADALAAHEKEMARALEAVQERALRAQIEKQSKRRLAEARSEAKSEADAAVLAHLAESQADLGTTAAPERLPAAEELVPGTRVRVRGFSAPVVLRRRDGGTVEVEAGPLRMKVPLAEIIAIVTEQAAQPATGRPASAVSAAKARPGGQAARPGGITVRSAPPDAPATAGRPGETDEINVIGCTVEEATRRVDKFLDTAVLAGKARLRVIHGHGTGALRRGLAEFFAAHPLVERIHAEADERGGTAVTVVELKD